MMIVSTLPVSSMSTERKRRREVGSLISTRKGWTLISSRKDCFTSLDAAVVYVDREKEETRSSGKGRTLISTRNKEEIVYVALGRLVVGDSKSCIDSIHPSR